MSAHTSQDKAIFPFGRCRVATGAAAAAADDGCFGINLIPRPGARGRAGSKRKMARCAGHGFDDVADEGDSGCCTKHPVLAKSKLGGGVL